jgi:hypothetical protein
MSGSAVTRVSAKCRNNRWFLRPLVAPMLMKPKIIQVFVGAAILQILLTAAGLRGWPCPIDTVFGIACPGCRLSTALTLLLQGDWHSAVQVHGFAPVILAGIMALLVISMLPAGWRRRVAHRMAVLESKTGFTAAIIMGCLIYWGVRCGIGF